VLEVDRHLTNRVRNEELLHRVKKDRNTLHTIKRKKASWIGHILRRNCLLKHVVEGKIGGNTEETGSRGRRRKQLLNGLKAITRCSYSTETCRSVNKLPLHAQYVMCAVGWFCKIRYESAANHQPMLRNIREEQRPLATPRRKHEISHGNECLGFTRDDKCCTESSGVNVGL
jgi:hypothetical protein